MATSKRPYFFYVGPAFRDRFRYFESWTHHPALPKNLAFSSMSWIFSFDSISSWLRPISLRLRSIEECPRDVIKRNWSISLSHWVWKLSASTDVFTLHPVSETFFRLSFPGTEAFPLKLFYLRCCCLPCGSFLLSYGCCSPNTSF